MSSPRSEDAQSASDSDLSSSPAVTPPTPPAPINVRSGSTARLTSDQPPTAGNMTSSSTPLGPLNAARRPPAVATASSGASSLPSSMQAKMRAFHLSRQGAPPGGAISGKPGGIPPSSPGGVLAGSVPSGAMSGGMVASPGPGAFQLPPGVRPPALNVQSAPVIPKMPGKGGLAAKRGLAGGLKLSNAQGPPPTAGAPDDASAAAAKPTETAFSKYSEYVDTATGTLRFKGKATIHGSGVEFSSGHTFNISLDEVDTQEELGKGNYGTVYQVRHTRPRMRRPGMGLAGNKAPPSLGATRNDDHGTQQNTSGQVMAMKEIRLELDDAKFAAIIMELEVLHKCVSPFIVDFYGAFFQEGAVYICMEFMNGGSIDKLYSDGMPENVLRKVALSTVTGLKALKEEHNIIHRDVKPTNILVNTRGQVKICDFGVSGNLVASIAKTNIGCQSYMAPERISSGGVTQAGAGPGISTYSVQSDIWSLGLTLIECALGRYPYPPETYNNIFSQLSAIVDGDPPDLPKEGFSDAARDFVRSCLHKIPKQRPTYAMLLRHPWLAPLLQPAPITEDAEAEAEAEAAAAAAATSGSSPEQGTGTGTDTSSSAPAVPSGLAAALTVETTPPDPADHADTADPEVAAWVRAALEKKRQGKLRGASKPALHAAPLDVVTSPPAHTMGESRSLAQ